ncbi:MAG: FHA domain-containing protein [Planctomycetes bacterium]|nr:FHA domain-containing protein [Planctomycetota bacterium]
MASLVITHANAIGDHFTLAEALTSIGREDDCTIQVLDEKVSRKHLQIRFDPATKLHYAGDYRSANGVFVNGKQLLSDVALNDGDRIRIGDTILLYFVADFPDKAAAHAAVKKAGEWAKDTLTSSRPN